MNEESKRIKRLFLLPILLMGLIYLFLFQGIIYAETSSPEYKLNKEYFIRFKNNFMDVLTSPKNWERNDILKLSAVIGSGVLIYAFDQDLYSWLQDRRTPLSKDLSKYVSKLGNGAYLTGFIAILYASGEFSNNDNLRKTALLSLESWLTSGAIVLGMKFLFGRARPQSGDSSHSFYPFSSRANYTSFPSGDAASAFAVATTVAQQSEKKSVDFVAYSLATLVAVYRIHDRKHWPSDAFIGSALGYFVAKKISSLNRNQDLEKLKLSFQLSREKQSLSFALSF